MSPVEYHLSTVFNIIPLSGDYKHVIYGAGLITLLDFNVHCILTMFTIEILMMLLTDT